MFTFMNVARIGTAVQGLAAAARSDHYIKCALMFPTFFANTSTSVTKS